MKEIRINQNEEGQRLDKYLLKLLDKAPKSFVYKMLRKKNIKLNDKKAEGGEILSDGDVLSIYLSDETFGKFSANISGGSKNIDIDIVYEDENIIIVNKPVGLLSQPASETGEDSVNQRICEYLGKNERAFTPGIANRLDRNTSGIILCAKNYPAAKELSAIIAGDLIDKYYYAVIEGKLDKPLFLKGYHKKDEKSNTAIITEEEVYGSKVVFTEVYPVETTGRVSLVKIKIITGKSHQIRAHLKSVNCPVLGDGKYGEGGKYRQLLHAGEVVFKVVSGRLEYISGRRFTAEWPSAFENAYKEYFKG